MTFKNDYRLGPEIGSTIKCQQCGQPATTGQNNGGAPFWYHCDACAEVGRQTGHFYSEADSLQGCRESDRIAEGLDAMGKSNACSKCGGTLQQHEYTTGYHTWDCSVQTIDITPVGCQTPEGRKRVEDAQREWDSATHALANVTKEIMTSKGGIKPYEIQRLLDLSAARDRKQEAFLRAVIGQPERPPRPKLKTYPATVNGKTVQVTIPED